MSTGVTDFCNFIVSIGVYCCILVKFAVDPSVTIGIIHRNHLVDRSLDSPGHAPAARAAARARAAAASLVQWQSTSRFTVVYTAVLNLVLNLNLVDTKFSTSESICFYILLNESKLCII